MNRHASDERARSLSRFRRRSRGSIPLFVVQQVWVAVVFLSRWMPRTVSRHMGWAEAVGFGFRRSVWNALVDLTAVGWQLVRTRAEERQERTAGVSVRM
jgi:hypothetical protein